MQREHVNSIKKPTLCNLDAQVINFKFGFSLLSEEEWCSWPKLSTYRPDFQNQLISTFVANVHFDGSALAISGHLKKISPGQNEWFFPSEISLKLTAVPLVAKFWATKQLKEQLKLYNFQEGHI